MEWNGIIGKIKSKNRRITADEAYFRTRYGSYKSREQMVESYQRKIEQVIKSKSVLSLNTNNETRFDLYYCLVNFNEDMVDYIDDVFKPFINNGFQVINLSERIPEIGNMHVYLVSWDKFRRETR